MSIQNSDVVLSTTKKSKRKNRKSVIAIVTESKKHSFYLNFAVNVVKRIHFDVTNEDYDHIIDIKDRLGTTIKDLYAEALLHFLVDYKHDINRGMQEHFLVERTRMKQRHLHFLKNWMSRLCHQVAPRLKLGLDYNHEMVVDIIQEAETFFNGVLDDKEKRMMLPELKKLQTLKDERHMNTWIENTLPELYAEQKTRRQLK